MAATLLWVAAAGSAERRLPCSITGGFGQKFGATSIVGTITNAIYNNATIASPPEPWPPYTKFSVSFTRKSNRVFGATAGAAFQSKGAAVEFAENLVTDFRREIKISEQIGDPGVSVTLYTGTRGEKIKIAGKEKLVPDDGLKIWILVHDKEVFVTCEDVRLARVDLEEAAR